MEIYEVSTEFLLSFRDSSLYRYCQSCSQFGKRWSCPPVEKSSSDFLPDDVSFVAIEYADNSHERYILRNKLESELRSQYETVFSAGHCERCDVCLRESNKKCTDFLYSAEVLCIDMVSLYKHLTGKELDLSGFSMMFIMQEKNVNSQSNFHNVKRDEVSMRNAVEISVKSHENSGR